MTSFYGPRRFKNVSYHNYLSRQRVHLLAYLCRPYTVLFAPNKSHCCVRGPKEHGREMYLLVVRLDLEREMPSANNQHNLLFVQAEELLSSSL